MAGDGSIEANSLSETKSAQVKVKLRRISVRNSVFEIALTAIMAVSAATYVPELAMQGHYTQIAFVAFFLLATANLSRGLIKIRKCMVVQGRVFFGNKPSSSGLTAEMAHLRFVSSVFDFRSRVLCGLIYGAVAVAGVAYVTSYEWRTSSEALLLVFVFLGNAVTGAGLWSAFSFVSNTRTLTTRLNVNPWSPENQSTQFFLELTRLVTLVATVYVAISLFSLMFANFPFVPIVSIYIGFCLSTLMFVAVMPYITVLNQLRVKRRKILYRLGSRIEKNTQDIIGGSAATKSNDVYERTKQLLELRDSLKKTSYLPIQFGSVRTFLSVVLISILPVLFDRALDFENLLKGLSGAA